MKATKLRAALKLKEIQLDYDVIKELEEIERLASKQEPMKVKIEKYLDTNCPVCGHVLSVHHGDGHYSIENKIKYCQGCGQLLAL